MSEFGSGDCSLSGSGLNSRWAGGGSKATHPLCGKWGTGGRGGAQVRMNCGYRGIQRRLDRRRVGVVSVSSKSTDGNRNSQTRSPQTLSDDTSFAFARKQMLQGDATDGCGEHRVVPPRHIYGENPGGFIADDPGALVREDYGDGNLNVGTPQMELFCDHASGGIEEKGGALERYALSGISLDTNLRLGGKPKDDGENSC